MAKPKKSVKVKNKSSAAKKSKIIKKKLAKAPMAKRKTKKVSAIPKGYNGVIPYLMVKDSADKAINFYKKVFGAKELMRMDHNGKIGHAELKLGDTRIMVADAYYQSENNSANTSIAIHLYVKNVDDIVSRAISAGAKIINAVEDKFYGDRNGIVEDPHGFQWCLSSRIENLSPAKLKKRAMEFYKNNS